MSVCLIPGKKTTVVATPPPGQSTALYCLFTDCQDEWKHLIEALDNCTDITIILGEHGISSIETR